MQTATRVSGNKRCFQTFSRCSLVTIAWCRMNRRVYAPILVLLWALFAPICVVSEGYNNLTNPFDARQLSYDDKRFLQTALAFDGVYRGLLDGAWGRLSQQAMESYAKREFGESPKVWHMAVLVSTFLEHAKQSGWLIRYYNELGLSFLFPSSASDTEAPTEQFSNWRHTKSSLKYSAGVHSTETVARLHGYAVEWHELATEPYVIRKKGFAVTSSVRRNRSVLYVRSNYVNGRWSTIMLSAEAEDASILNAVSASISVGEVAPLTFSDGGGLDQAMIQLIALMKEYEERPDDDQPETKAQTGAGSGFFVSESGHVLTNAHVVGGCNSVWVDGSPVKITATSEAFDLALLSAKLPQSKSFASFSSGPARLNSDVTVAGYPYLGKLSGLNVTRGAVSSLVGLGGEPTQVQITAPVQSGNSGGPVVALDGSIVGVVVSKLDAELVSDALGDVPQNVNFAVRGEIAKLFLSQNGVEPVIVQPGEPMKPADLADHAKRFTVFVECR